MNDNSRRYFFCDQSIMAWITKQDQTTDIKINREEPTRETE